MQIYTRLGMCIGLVLPRYRKTLYHISQGLCHDMNIYHDIELTVTFVRQTYTYSSLYV